MRDTKESAGIELPPKTFETIHVDLEHRQRELDHRYIEELQHVVIRDGTPTMDDAEQVLKRLTRLIQVASNPRLIDEGYRAECGKMAALKRLVGEAADVGEKTIVWTGFISNARWLAEKSTPSAPSPYTARWTWMPEMLLEDVQDRRRLQGARRDAGCGEGRTDAHRRKPCRLLRPLVEPGRLPPGARSNPPHHADTALHGDEPRRGRHG